MQADFTKDIVETDGEWYVPSLGRTFVSADWRNA